MVGIITQVGSRDRAKNNVGSGIPGTRGEFFVLEEVSLLGQGTRICREKNNEMKKKKDELQTRPNEMNYRHVQRFPYAPDILCFRKQFSHYRI